MKKIIAFLFIVIFISCSALSGAAEIKEEYTAYDKFTRGLFNFITCGFELPITVHDVYVNENPIMGILYGVPLGVGKSGVRFVVGITELFTFPVPPFEPMMEPGTLFQREE